MDKAVEVPRIFSEQIVGQDRRDIPALHEAFQFKHLSAIGELVMRQHAQLGHAVDHHALGLCLFDPLDDALNGSIELDLRWKQHRLLPRSFSGFGDEFEKNRYR